MLCIPTPKAVATGSDSGVCQLLFNCAMKYLVNSCAPSGVFALAAAGTFGSVVGAAVVWLDEGVGSADGLAEPLLTDGPVVWADGSAVPEHPPTPRPRVTRTTKSIKLPRYRTNRPSLGGLYAAPSMPRTPKSRASSSTGGAPASAAFDRRRGGTNHNANPPIERESAFSRAVARLHRRRGLCRQLSAQSGICFCRLARVSSDLGGISRQPLRREIRTPLAPASGRAKPGRDANPHLPHAAPMAATACRSSVEGDRDPTHLATSPHRTGPGPRWSRWETQPPERRL